MVDTRGTTDSKREDSVQKTRVRYVEARKAAATAVAKAKADSSEKCGEVLVSNLYMANKGFCHTIRRLRGEKKGALRVLKDISKMNSFFDDGVEYSEKLLNPAQPKKDPPVEHKSRDITISVDETAEAVKSLKNGKAAGIDEIHPEMLK
ncbi:unnamed protein product, partial [Soboliphyme baturini]|uniref:Reverse transcriptase domain-containing protein n=1 Tax=Soboliphyme baturini TaxID=241478 RepID=A0A183IH04_9BILA